MFAGRHLPIGHALIGFQRQATTEQGCFRRKGVEHRLEAALIVAHEVGQQVVLEEGF
jgi:hypothetical protein